MKVIGHRGARGLAPENTIAGFKRGIDEGSDYIEFDVNLTKDKKVVVIHDAMLDRTTDLSGVISGFTWEDINAADAGSWFSEEYKGEKLVLLEEALEFIVPGAIPIIELKMNFVLNQGLEDAVAKICNDFILKSKILVISFFHPALKRMKDLLPEIKTGILYNSALLEPWILADAIKADSIHPRGDAISKEIVSKCHKLNYPVGPWIANTVEEFKYFKGLGVDALGTDFPDRLREFNLL